MSIKKLEHLFHCLETHGQRSYGRSQVSQLEHALQAADHATTEGLGDAMIAAALFHDIGHLVAQIVCNKDIDLAARGINDNHEDRSAAVLMPLFGWSVSEPVQLHVEAKRFLCTTEPDYRELITSDSIRSLQLQGGDMSSEEVRLFQSNPYHEAAVLLRRIDDKSKQPGKTVPELATYFSVAEGLLPASVA